MLGAGDSVGTFIVVLFIGLVIYGLVKGRRSTDSLPDRESRRVRSGGTPNKLIEGRVVRANRSSMRPAGVSKRVDAERRRPLSPEKPAPRIPFAKPGLRGSLFTYGGWGHNTLNQTIDGPFAVVDFQTTGLAPNGGDRIIEAAVVRVEADGTIGEPWSSLVHPGRDTGATFIHHIETADVENAPTFSEIAPYLLTLLEGSVVVAHNATFDEAFLAAELKRAGYSNFRMPALCSLWLAQTTFDTSNHKLSTLARELNVPVKSCFSADHVIATAHVLREGIRRSSRPIQHGCDVYPPSGAAVPAPRVVNRVIGLRKGTDGYMGSLMSKLPSVSAELGSAEEEIYLDVLSSAMADGQITRDEASELGRIAGNAGMSRQQLLALNERFLETMREAAFDDDVLTGTELRELKRAARALGVPQYFDDLVVTPSGTRSVNAQGDQVASASSGRRCGHCGEAGHYRPTCPQLANFSERPTRA